MKLIRTPLQWLVVLLVAMFNTSAVYVSRQPHSLEAEECSRLYQRYAGSTDVRATYIQNYHVNDTLTLSATLLEAITDSGWAELINVFNVCIMPCEQESIDNGYDVLFLINNERCQKGLLSNSDIAVLSARDKYACVFNNVDSINYDKVIDAILSKIFKSLNNNSNFIQNEETL